MRTAAICVLLLLGNNGSDEDANTEQMAFAYCVGLQENFTDKYLTDGAVTVKSLIIC